MLILLVKSCPFLGLGIFHCFFFSSLAAKIYYMHFSFFAMRAKIHGQLNFFNLTILIIFWEVPIFWWALLRDSLQHFLHQNQLVSKHVVEYFHNILLFQYEKLKWRTVTKINVNHGHKIWKIQVIYHEELLEDMLLWDQIGHLKFRKQCKEFSS